MAGPGLRFQGPLPRLPNLTWEGAKRELWNWLRKLGDANSSVQTFVDATFGTPGGALQGLLTTKGDLLGHDSSTPVRIPVDADGKVLTGDSAASPGVSWQVPVGADSAPFEDCVSFFRLDEATGARRDAIGRFGFKDLIELSPGITSAAGKLGSAVQFVATATNDLFLPDSSWLAAGDFDFYISTWIYLDSKPSVMYALAKDGGGVAPDREYGILYTSTGDKLQAFLGLTTGAILVIDLLTPVSVAAWYHVVIWHDAAADTFNGQVNGGSVVSVSTGGVAPYTSGRRFILGARRDGSPTSFWDGRVDATGWFLGLPNAAIRAALYNGGAGLELFPLWSVRPNSEQMIVGGQVFGRW